MMLINVKVFPEKAYAVGTGHGKSGQFWVDPAVIEIDPAQQTYIVFESLGGEELDVDMEKLHPGATFSGNAPFLIQIPANQVPQGMYNYSIRVGWVNPAGITVWVTAHGHSDPRAKVYP